MRWFLFACRQYPNFQGRASRAEFWHFQITTYVLASLITAIGAAAPVVGTFFLWLFSLLVTLPSFAVSTRRLHDIGLSASLLKRMATLGVTQVASWFGVLLSRGEDSLAWGAACAVSGISVLMWFALHGMYCLPGHSGPNSYGAPAPPSPG